MRKIAYFFLNIINFEKSEDEASIPWGMSDKLSFFMVAITNAPFCYIFCISSSSGFDELDLVGGNLFMVKQREEKGDTERKYTVRHLR